MMIFAGETVNMQRLEDLFYGIERHRLAKLAKQTGLRLRQAAAAGLIIARCARSWMPCSGQSHKANARKKLEDRQHHRGSMMAIFGVVC